MASAAASNAEIRTVTTFTASFDWTVAIARLRAAVAEAEAAHLAGYLVMGTDFSCVVSVWEGAAALVAGEETALLAALAGDRGMPVIRPPYPTERGLHGTPRGAALRIGTQREHAGQHVGQQRSAAALRQAAEQRGAHHRPFANDRRGAARAQQQAAREAIDGHGLAPRGRAPAAAHGASDPAPAAAAVRACAVPRSPPTRWPAPHRDRRTRTSARTANTPRSVRSRSRWHR